MKNFALYISIISLIALVTGCTSYTTPAGNVRTTPVSVSVDSTEALTLCIDRRVAQRTRLIRESGIRTEAAPTEVQVSYRDSVQLICTQSDRRETAGESRTISREECTRLLAPDGIPADANGTVRTEAPAPATDPLLRALMAANPALFRDDDEVCNNRVIGGGGMNGMAINGQVGGIAQVGGFGGVGIMPGAFGLGGATRDIWLDARYMNPNVTAVVNITSASHLSGAAQGTVTVNSSQGAMPISVLDGFDYQVNVSCLVNGVPIATRSHSTNFSRRIPSGGNVLLYVICGRDRG